VDGCHAGIRSCISDFLDRLILWVGLGMGLSPGAGASCE